MNNNPNVIPLLAPLAFALSMFGGTTWAAQTEPVSIDQNGVLGSGTSYVGSMNPNGRYIVFTSMSRNLSGDQRDRYQVFRRDRLTGRTEIVSDNVDGVLANMPSANPSLTDDGRFVTFATAGSNLIPGDTNLDKDVFVKDMNTGAVERVSISSYGDQANSQSDFPEISGDGRYVMFESTATNLAAGDTNNTFDIYIHDRQTKTTRRIGGNGISFLATMSRNGRYIVFTSTADNLIANDLNNAADVFLYDQQTGTLELVSLAADGSQGNNGSTHGTISNDGRFLAFTSAASNLVPGDTNGMIDVFLLDRQSGELRRISNGLGGQQSNGFSMYSAISPDGRYVGFISAASNLIANDTNGVSDIFIYDRITGAIEIEPIGYDGNLANIDVHPLFAWNGDGSLLGFASAAPNVVPNDNNNVSDVFVRIRDINTPPVANAGVDQAKQCVSGGTAFTLNGAASYDADGDPLSFSWNGPFGVVNGNIVNVNLGVGTHYITLTVTDSAGATSSDDVVFTVTDSQLPVVNAGPDVNLEAVAIAGAPYNLPYTAYDTCSAVSVTVAPTPNYYPLGTTDVTVTAADAYSNIASDVARVTVADTTPPLVTPPPDVTTEATGVLTAVAIGTATANDIFPVTLSNDAPVNFPLGTTSTTWTATDSNGNTATAVQQVHVVDTTAPVLTVPPNLQVEATAPAMVLNIGSATATDIFDVTITNNAPATFGIGDTVVTWTATDANGNRVTATQLVSVVDTQPPVVDAGPDRVIEAVSLNGAPFVPTYNVSYRCGCGAIQVTVSPQLSIFPLGATTVTVTATDSSGNSASDSFLVTVVDATPPVLTLPPNISVEAVGPQTVVDIGAASASDIFPVTIAHDAPAAFGVGTTIVTWTARDANGNVARATQQVTVVDTIAPTFEFEIRKPELWPPRFNMVLAATVSDVRDRVDGNPVVDINVTSNGDHPRHRDKADWKIVHNGDTWEIWLRAERLIEPHKDRIYDISVTIGDIFGNRAQTQGRVIVPGSGKDHKHRDNANKTKDEHHHNSHRD